MKVETQRLTEQTLCQDGQEEIL